MFLDVGLSHLIDKSTAIHIRGRRGPLHKEEESGKITKKGSALQQKPESAKKTISKSEFWTFSDGMKDKEENLREEMTSYYNSSRRWSKMPRWISNRYGFSTKKRHNLCMQKRLPRPARKKGSEQK